MAVPSRKISPWIDGVVLSLVFVALAVWSWRKCPDLTIDFGMQAYIPWQITQGKHLYTDIAWKYGPFSQYLDAALFRLCGVSLTTLFVANLANLALITTLLYRIFVQFTERWVTVVIGIVFLSVFGIAQYTWMGNWNYVTPYVPEAGHSVTLSLAALWGLTRYQTGLNLRWLWLSGTCFGLICLTKIEAVVAVGGCLSVGLALIAFIHQRTPRQVAGMLLHLGGATAVPILLGVFLLWTRMPLATVVEGLLANVTLTVKSDMANSRFYKKHMGTDDIAGNLGMMVRLFGGLLLVVAGGVGLERVLGRQDKKQWLFRFLIFAGVSLLAVLRRKGAVCFGDAGKNHFTVGHRNLWFYSCHACRAFPDSRALVFGAGSASDHRLGAR
ncbi:MAG: glycosyltransferase family 39 protein [Blastocatellia bacterium]|nr:glycosyltransferase family 39 protein [Blastocatellia bacterium]